MSVLKMMSLEEVYSLMLESKIRKKKECKVLDLRICLKNFAVVSLLKWCDKEKKERKQEKEAT